MEKLRSTAELEARRKAIRAAEPPRLATLIIPAGTCGQASGANDLIRVAKRELLYRGLADALELRITGCHGFCQAEPSVLVLPRGTFYPRLAPKDMPRIVAAAAQGKIVEDLLYQDPETGERIERQQDIPFFAGQRRQLLARNELVDPIRIQHALEQDGYAALGRLLDAGNPAAVVAELKASGLRGRGGAGFPTGAKWEMLAARPSGQGKYLVCNADEGDPGAYMDRSVLEGNPHSVLEGMLIGAYATGATRGIIYVRDEYPLAIKHVLIALRQARDLGLLGADILGTGFSFDIDIVRGAGAFVCGEETALIRSIEGHMGEPRQRPPYPIDSGIFGAPTAINNVETFANVPLVFALGGNGYAATGVSGNTGTKIFSLVGKIRNTGLVEVPLGTPLADVVFEIGGGPESGAQLKAVQTGGPSGGCIPARLFDLPIGYESLAQVGSIMGSGGMIVMDDRTCMVDVARYFTRFLKDESCGKCFPCRKGTQRLSELLDDVTTGHATLDTLGLIEELGQVVRDTTLCGLGQTAANPVLASLRHFRDEYVDHVVRKRCDAGVCKELVSAPCQHRCPLGQEVPLYTALVARGEFAEALAVIKKDNPLCNTLARVCPHPCETRCRAGQAGDPLSIRALKRVATDYGLAHNLLTEAPRPARETGKRVAIVGSGPAGLTCAFFLAQRGHEVTVFERENHLGGMLALAIPTYRLPREVLQADLRYIESAGITFKTGQALGRDFSIDELFARGFAAVFVATGAHRSLRLNIPGEDAQGVHAGLALLGALHAADAPRIGPRVGVIGGGNAAVDVARSVLRSGQSHDVTLYYRRTRGEMPAYAEEVAEALEEGVRLVQLVAPLEVLSVDGRVVGCRFTRMQPGPREPSGRRRPVPREGDTFDVALDTLVVAVSETTEAPELAPASGLTCSPWGSFEADPDTYATARPGVFAGGDGVTGPSSVVQAAAAGRIAAGSIDQQLRGETIVRHFAPTRPSRYLPLVGAAEGQTVARLGGRAIETRRDPVLRSHDRGEVTTTLPGDVAQAEARRCLRCELATSDGEAFLKALNAAAAPAGA